MMDPPELWPCQGMLFFCQRPIAPFLPAVREIKSETNPITGTRELGKRGMEGREKILTERQQRRRGWRRRRFLPFRFQFPEPGPELMSGGGGPTLGETSEEKEAETISKSDFFVRVHFIKWGGD